MTGVQCFREPVQLLAGVVLTLCVAACGGGGGGGSANGGDRAVAQTEAGSPTAAEVVTQRRAISTPMNVPIVFATPTGSEDPGVQGRWYLPSRGSLAFLRRPGEAAYIPPLGFQGTEEFRHESEHPDGRIERTLFTARIDPAEPPARPSVCPGNSLADEQVVRLAAHPALPNQLVALRRNGLALEALRSEDGGVSWAAGDSIPAETVDVLAFDAASDGLIQATTAGVSWHSVDGGLSWEEAVVPTWQAGQELPYYLAGNQLLRRPDPGSAPHVMFTSAIELIRLIADPRNHKRIYLLTAEGLYTLFEDNLPGIDPMIENIIIAPVATGFEEPLQDMTVDAGGRILIAGASRIYCVEGDRPFKDPVGINSPAMTFLEVGDEARLQLELPEISEPTELSIWLQGTRFVTSQPGVVEDPPAVQRIITLQPDDDRTLTLTLPLADTGMYKVGAVLRTAAGIVGQNRETILANPDARFSASVDLTAQASTTLEPDGSATVQVSVNNTGPYAADEVELRLETSGDSRLQSPALTLPGHCRAGTRGLLCTLTDPLPAGSEASLTLISRTGTGAPGALNLSVTSSGNEIRREDNFWSSDPELADRRLSISTERLRRRPLQGTEALFRLTVTNDGVAPARPFVEGYLERHEGDPIVNYGDWLVAADGGSCAMPAQLCGPGACPEARSHRQHYRCEFQEPLSPAEAHELTISMKTAVEGERVRSVALVGGGYEQTSRDNLSVAEISLTNEPEPGSPNPPAEEPSCGGLLLLITWGACRNW